LENLHRPCQVTKPFISNLLLRFGTLAGWAHTVLFAGDLAKFQNEVVNANRKETKENQKKKKEVDSAEEKENAVNSSKRKAGKTGKGKRKVKKNKH
jgi:hypothetical protein